MAWVRAPAPWSCVPGRCWGQGSATLWSQEPLKCHPMAVQGNFVPESQGDELQLKLSPSGAPLSPPWAWDPSKFLVFDRMSQVAQVAPVSVCGPANGHQRDCGEASGVVAQRGGSAKGGQGSLPSLSLLVAMSVLGWNSNQSLQTLRPGQPQRWAVPGAAALMGTARKVDSSDLNHAGWLPVKRHQLSHRCSHWAGHRDVPQLAQMGDAGVGRVPTQA